MKRALVFLLLAGMAGCKPRNAGEEPAVARLPPKDTISRRAPDSSEVLSRIGIRNVRHPVTQASIGAESGSPPGPPEWRSVPTSRGPVRWALVHRFRASSSSESQWERADYVDQVDLRDAQALNFWDRSRPKVSCDNVPTAPVSIKRKGGKVVVALDRSFRKSELVLDGPVAKLILSGEDSCTPAEFNDPTRDPVECNTESKIALILAEQTRLTAVSARGSVLFDVRFSGDTVRPLSETDWLPCTIFP